MAPRSVLVAEALRCCFLATAVLATIYVDNIYNLNHLVDGSFTPGPNFEDDARQSLRASAATSVSTYVGLWLIKLNFLLFFYRLGTQLPKFLIAWWIIFVFVLAAGVGQIGIVRFDCMVHHDINAMLEACSTIESLYDTRHRFIASVTLDVLTDFCVRCFPISILWVSRIHLQQKLILSALFSLVLFVIAITLVRGGFSANIHNPTAAAQLNTSTNFWVNLEYLVSFLIACCVSFRSLFIQRRKRATAEHAGLRSQRQQRPMNEAVAPKGSIGRLGAHMRQWHDSVLDTCRDLEGADTEVETNPLPQHASGAIPLNFFEGEGPNDWTAVATMEDGSRHAPSRTSCHDSVKSLKPKQTPQSQV